MKSPSVQPINESIIQLESQIPQWMKDHNIQGLSISITDQYKLVWSKGFGVCNNKTKEPVSLDTVFHSASLSKPLFAIMVLHLYEQGIINIDKPIAHYYPDEIRKNDGYFNEIINEKYFYEITPRHILSHSTGLPNWRPHCRTPKGWQTQNKPITIYFKPGERFTYSSEAYVLLQIIIEHLINQPAQLYMEKNILQPLKMMNSSYIYPFKEDISVASGHNETGIPQNINPVEKMISASSLKTTAENYSKFILSILQHSENNSTILNKSSIQQILTPQIKVNDSMNGHKDWQKKEILEDKTVQWGLGWGLELDNNTNTFWHWGDAGVYTSFAMGDILNKRSIVLLANSPGLPKIRDILIHSVLGIHHPALLWLKRIYDTPFEPDWME